MPRLERSYHDLSRPLREFHLVVDAPNAGRRLDALLPLHFPWRSRAHFQRMVARGEVLVDDKPAKASTRVRRGSRIVVKLPQDPTAPERESADDLVFIYEDEHVAAIDKPSGLAVHPSGRIRHGTLINKLHARYRSDDPREDVVPRLAHRIDQDTSGLVLVVKSRRVDALVTEAFTRRQVKKTYLAILRGVPEVPEGWVDAPIGPDPAGASHLNMRVDPTGLPARSRWTVLRSWPRHALVRLEPHTGRTHQLRVHMAHRGHAIACDHLYGDVRPLCRYEVDPRYRGADPILSRLALHSHTLEIDHPITGKPLRFESPLAPDLQRATEALDRYAVRDAS